MQSTSFAFKRINTFIRQDPYPHQRSEMYWKAFSLEQFVSKQTDLRCNLLVSPLQGSVKKYSTLIKTFNVRNKFSFGNDCGNAGAYRNTKFKITKINLSEVDVEVR